MKLIFSRKGFDASAGGGNSPVMPDGDMVSLPIPAARDRLHWNEVAGPGERSLGALMAELGLDTRCAGCHLDPDLRHAARPRLAGWRPNLGQVDAAAGHLRNQQVAPGDLFLFFGRFCHTETTAHGLRFLGPALHALWGYLQIGRIIRTVADPIPEWLDDHPHVVVAQRRLRPTNTIYLAGDALSLHGIGHATLPAAGTFRFHPSLALTRADSTRLTRWSLPRSVFADRSISYHPQPWQPDGSFRAASKGQEFVVGSWDQLLAQWVVERIEAGTGFGPGSPRY